MAFEGNTLTTVVTVSTRAVSSAVHLRVNWAKGSQARRVELDGFAGKMTRLRQAYDALNAAWPITWSADSLIDAMQTGDRLTYHPENIQEEIARFTQTYAHSTDWIKTQIENAKGSDSDLAKKLDAAKSRTDISEEEVAHYRLMLNRALADVEDSASAPGGKI